MKFYYTETDFIETVIEPEYKNIAVLMSGGIDSAILMYFLIKTIQEQQQDVKIYAITAESMRRPQGIRYSNKVMTKLTEITGFTNYGEHLIFPVVIPTEEVKVMTHYTKHFMKMYKIDRLFNGTTTNPPKDVTELMTYHRYENRDDPKGEGKLLREDEKKLDWPLLYVNKRDVYNMFVKYGLLDTILPETRSCIGDTELTNFHRTPCMKCWGCLEKFWGFGEY